MQDPTVPTFKRTRTDLMWATLAASNLVIENNCLILAGKVYRIIDSSLDHWCQEEEVNLASVGGNVTSREILLINSRQGKLLELLNTFIRIATEKRLKVETHNKYSPFFDFAPNDQIERLLKHLASIVSQTLAPNVTETQRIIDQKKAARDNCVVVNEQYVPCIDFDVFLNAKIGVCRFYAILTCLHLGNLIKHGYLPPGEITLKRFATLSSAHAVACYTNNAKCWTIDPTEYFSKKTIPEPVTYSRVTFANETEATLPLDEPPASPSQNSSSPSQLC